MKSKNKVGFGRLYDLRPGNETGLFLNK